MGENRTEMWSKASCFHWFDTVKFFMGIYNRKQHSIKHGVPGRKSIAVEPRRAYFSDGAELRISNQDKDFSDLEFPGLWNITKTTKTRVEVVRDQQEVEDLYPDIDAYILSGKTEKNTVYELVVPTEYLRDGKDWASITLCRIMKCADTQYMVDALRFLNAFNDIGKSELTITVLRDGIIFLENFMFQVVLMPIDPQWEKQTKIYETF